MMNQKNPPFSREELIHYSRHFSVPEIGIDGQERLKKAKVAVAGAGGLGIPILQYLAAAGVGTIGIIDFDTIERSNLHRQVLYGTPDIGRPKAAIAAERLKEMNPHIRIEVHDVRLTSANALDILQQYDMVADGTDNFPARYLINDASVFLGLPNIHGSVHRFEGQLSVFNHIDKKGNRGVNYRDLFPDPPPPELVPDCAEAGVLGVLPGIIGCLQANEVLKIITGAGEVMSGKLLMFDALNLETRVVHIPADPANPLTGDHPSLTKLIDYEAFCSGHGTQEPESRPAEQTSEQEPTSNEDSVPESTSQQRPGPVSGGSRLSGHDSTYQQNLPPRREVTVVEYKAMIDRGETHQLIDVREPYEQEIADLGGERIPLSSILEQADKIKRERPVVIHCRSGRRSAEAIRRLQQEKGFTNLYNLKGGILAWSREIDSRIPTY